MFDFLKNLRKSSLFLAKENSKLRQRIRDLEKNLLKDPYFDCYNKTFIIERINEERRFQKRGGEFLIAFIDIDDFGKQNKQKGWVWGDGILSKTIAIFKKNLRKTDLLARYGGDEFVILFRESESLRSEVLSRLVSIQAMTKKLKMPTLSIGVASTLEQAMDNALKMKNGGKNGIDASIG